MQGGMTIPIYRTSNNDLGGKKIKNGLIGWHEYGVEWC